MHSNRSGRVGRAKYSERISNLRSKSSSFADDSNANLASLGSGRRVSSSQHEQKAVKRRFVPTPSSESSYNAHLKGKIHHRKLVAQQQDVKPNNLKAAVRCDLCSVACCSSRDFEAHVNGQKHQKTLKLMMNVNETISNMEYAATSENTAASLIGTELPPDELDCLVREKVVQIEKNVDDLREVEQLVLRVEETLYAVSEFLDQAVGIVGDAPPPQQKRFLRGIMRVQLMAKQLLLKSDKRVDLVLLCSVVPTTKLLFQIIELLRQIINKNNEQSIYVAEKIAESAIFVNAPVVAGNLPDLNYYPYEEPPNALPFGPCLMALTEMRRTKFYQVKCAPHASMRSLVKIMRDIRRRVPAWQVLTDWMIELSVEKVLSAGNNTELGPGAALRALFDAVSSSFILGKGTSLADPCEKLPFDVFAGVSDMARMNIYHSARYAIRQFKINKMDKLLALDGSPGIPSERPPKRKKVAELMAVTTTARNANSTLKNGGSSADAASATSDGRHNNLNKGRWRDEQLSNVIDKKDIKL
uniref:DZF domain-containing protein n=1 Tax=Globodera rostochiensis TaxID=31243 RepID=A0A914GTU5_GLORO